MLGARREPRLRAPGGSMHRFAFPAVVALVVFPLASGCGGDEEGGAPQPVEVERKIEPYSYPPPVSGHLSEVNTGEFDLVDGIAYPARDPAKGTVVFVTAKPIASPVLASSSCPATQARALTLLRDSAYAEVTLDGAGRSPSFIYGSPYGGQGRGIDAGSAEWGGEIAIAGGQAKGSVTHRNYGAFEFALPVAKTQPGEVSEEDRAEAGYAAWGGDAPAPTEVEAIAAYGLTYRAVMDGKLGAYLALQGFDEEQAAKIRGLAGIEDDFKAHGDRFLDPGAPESPMLENGFAGVGGRGTNSKGEAFFNYYEFTPCGGKLILTSIGLNPQ
jgi:hypothetical protein